MEHKKIVVQHVDWLNPMKAFALLAVMLNHFVEEFVRGSWFTNPKADWPGLAERLSNIFPHQYPFPISFVQFMGWLGDSGPGVFILASGFGLTWAALHRNRHNLEIKEFYRKRLLRIFPLYITIHILILACSLIIPGSKYSLASPHMLLSLMGLRFTDSLFSSINPSWWFIWLILQLYFIFPLLFMALKNCGLKYFLLITLLFTFASRFFGLADIRYSQSLYYWMTGIFFGTRLAEFAVGMALASLLFEKGQTQLSAFFGLKRILCLSWATYILGLISSFFWYTTIISNLLVTMGLSGLFYCLWESLVKKDKLSVTIITWTGINSYAIYLLHQTPLKWTNVFYDDIPHLVAAIIVLIISFPAGWLINLFVNFFLKKRKGFLKIFPTRLITWTVSTGVLLAEPLFADLIEPRLFALILGAAVALLLFSEFSNNHKTLKCEFGLRWAAIATAFLLLFAFPDHGLLATSIGVVFAAIALLLHLLIPSRIKTVTIAVILSVSLIVIIELGLRQYLPLETYRWGEYPALQPHPTRIYGLIPNKTTRLHYNNYDYILKTNSLGLAAPELLSEKPSPGTTRILVVGDAFSMPEGVEYENAYPALLETILNKTTDNKKVEVINGGVTGYGPVEQNVQIKELVPQLKPHIVVYQFFINEFQEAHIAPETRHQNIGFTTLPFRQQILSQSQIKEYLYIFRNKFAGMIKNKPSQKRYWKALLPFYEKENNEYYEQSKLDIVENYLMQMSDVCKQNRAKMVIYFVPAAIAVSKPEYISYYPWNQDVLDRSRFDFNLPFQHLQKMGKDLDIPVVDLTPELKKYHDQPVYFPGSWHWNAKGHKVAAKSIADDLRQRGALEQ